MKILLLNQAFHPDVVSTAQHASDLAARLVEGGHQVTVVSSRRAYDNPQERYAKHEVWRGVNIRRIPSPGLGKSAKWRRATDFASYIANCCLYLIALRRFDLVVAMTSPPLISWLGALFVRIKGGKFVFWVMDLNPDEAIAAGWLRADSWTTRCLSSMLLYSLRRADSIIALDRFMAKRIADKGISPDKIAVLPPWSHDQVVNYDPEGREQFRRLHGLTEKFVVMYSGNHSPCHPVETLLRAAHRLADQPHITFCFVGGGSEFEKVQQFARDHNLLNIMTLPYQSLEKLGASLSSADLHAVVMGDAFVGIVHPCKVYNIRTLGIPYLYIGPVASHISELKPELTARHGDVDSLVSQIRASAGSRADSRVLQPAEPGNAQQHSQNHVLSKMVLALESLGRPEHAQIRRSTWQAKSEY